MMTDADLSPTDAPLTSIDDAA
jgi:hypothetical protein